MIENLNRNVFFSAIKIISLGQSFPREYFLTPQVNQEKYPYFKLFNGARFLHENFIIEDVHLFIEKKIYYFSNTIRKDIVNGSNIKKSKKNILIKRRVRRLFLEIDTVFIKRIWKAIQVSIKYTGWGNKSYGHETSLNLFLKSFFFLFFFQT